MVDTKGYSKQVEYNQQNAGRASTGSFSNTGAKVTTSPRFRSFGKSFKKDFK